MPLRRPGFFTPRAPPCEAFDYPTSEPVGSGTELSFSETGVGTSYLSEGFSEPEPWGIWTNANQAVITLPLAVPTEKGAAA